MAPTVQLARLERIMEPQAFSSSLPFFRFVEAFDVALVRGGGFCLEGFSFSPPFLFAYA